jgi:uncharacterized protein YqhQ
MGRETEEFSSRRLQKRKAQLAEVAQLRISPSRFISAWVWRLNVVHAGIITFIIAATVFISAPIFIPSFVLICFVGVRSSGFR